jgi:starvation-inducible DNA-binding protein
MKPKDDISVLRKPVIGLEYSKILEDEYRLYSKTWTVHLSLGGEDFYDKNKFFESQYEQIDQFIDSVSERLISLGLLKPESLNIYLNFKRQNGKITVRKERKQFIQELLDDHEKIVVNLKDKMHRFILEFHDRESIDFIAGLKEGHEKIVLFLRSNL